MEEIKYLFIGESPYSYIKKDKKIKEKADYKNIQLPNYPTDSVAFFPYYTDNKIESNKEWLKIVTFRRIIGLLSNKRLSYEDNFYDIFQKTPKQIAKAYQKEKAYFCNLNEITIKKKNSNYLTIENNNKEWKIDSTTKILCFGREAIKYFTSSDFYEYKLKIATFPHPSTNNYNVFWKHYDKNFNPIIHNLDIDLLPPTP
ncbi:hypothetical protein QI102_08275 [Staphylococcus saprophyticus]|uniref:hypothetical protein n=1 Tax=Staphylococcus saprophyticus TaxID=29385 RepID=UPI0008536132|nr:hypothetical protein [Staphylococcus saprophyticus]MDW4036952.1 hypothetical protein [Staphylococcus saprophyticus]MDW4280230.1 hypothetical protein [Staphylococcus saprophyticus]MDW4294894.1 hypothetical protein [Staphylococcus saprophyticus]MDW4326679.1 hypothetical protein [Staphylococcus saprophyticus]MDW4346623.1 hypothetical protein [Staphylococcus saprophyticus]